VVRLAAIRSWTQILNDEGTKNTCQIVFLATMQRAIEVFTNDPPISREAEASTLFQPIFTEHLP
jgi:hypothetical protein